MEFTLARNHAGKLSSASNVTRTEGAGLANQGIVGHMCTHLTMSKVVVIEKISMAEISLLILPQVRHCKSNEKASHLCLQNTLSGCTFCPYLSFYLGVYSTATLNSTPFSSFTA